MDDPRLPPGDPAARILLIPPSGCGPTFDCGRCSVPMERGDLRFPAPRMVSRVGAPVPPGRVLPVWRCTRCGLTQPRIE